MPLCTLSELTGDFVVYRNLEPYDARVPGVSAAWREMGLAGPQVVRKSDPLYPQAARWILQRFHEINAPKTQLAEFLLIGDTFANDGGAYSRLAGATGWPGAAFIGKDALAEPVRTSWQGDIFVANRWQGLALWLEALQTRGLKLDERTVVIVDIDKTAFGARGRNHSPIDVARIRAISQTVRQALGDDADIQAFTEIYLELNRQQYHDLTGDNQDYLAYISILVGAGTASMAALRRRHAAGDLNDFAAFIAWVQPGRAAMPAGLARLHDAVLEAYQSNDPTPFKDFRRNEYRMTVENMGSLPDDAAASRRAAEEICLTREIWDACRWLQARGVTITSFSDKPDEACAPAPDLAASGYRAIHHTPTHLLGDPLDI
ncbi:MAG TPA: hypothetical protein G4N94_09690 [Caldilineae bacterium]|nr:hypothetical protein [Caldilineae bacterium]